MAQVIGALMGGVWMFDMFANGIDTSNLLKMLQAALAVKSLDSIFDRVDRSTIYPLFCLQIMFWVYMLFHLFLVCNLSILRTLNNLCKFCILAGSVVELAFVLIGQERHDLVEVPRIYILPTRLLFSFFSALYFWYLVGKLLAYVLVQHVRPFLFASASR